MSLYKEIKRRIRDADKTDIFRFVRVWMTCIVPCATLTLAWAFGRLQNQTAQPLRSICITQTSSLLRVVPPPCLAAVLSRLWGLHLRFPLNIETTGSHVPPKSLDQVHAISMPDAAQTINRLPLDLSWGCLSTPVLTPSQIFRHLINGSRSLISLILT